LRLRPARGFERVGRSLNAPGDAVFGMAMWRGTYAEYAAVPAGVLAKKLPSLGFASAAATSLAGLTAWQGVVEKLRVVGGETVLVVGASGGVGAFALQLAAPA